MNSKFDALLVDPDLQSRMRLKQATSSVAAFGTVQQVGDLKQASAAISSSEECDVVFLSSRCGKDDIKSFVATAKQSRQGQDAAYVLLLGANDQAGSSVATNVLIGVDGFLVEPYSVDSLVEITQLAARVKKERSSAREKIAIRLLVHEIMGQIDIVAQLKKGGASAGISSKSLRETCSVLQTLEGESLNTYFELALKMFEEAPVPPVQQTKLYSGASKRMREREEAKLLAKLQKDIETKKLEVSKAANQ